MNTDAPAASESDHDYTLEGVQREATETKLQAIDSEVNEVTTR